MPSLRALLHLVADQAGQGGVALPADLLDAIEGEVRAAYPSERVYIPPPDSRKDPARTAAIRSAARHLPTSFVAERFGCDPSWVRRVVKRK